MPAVSVFRAEVTDFSPEDGDSMFLQNVSIYQRVYMAPNPEEHHLFGGRFGVRLLNMQKCSVILYAGLGNLLTSILKTIRGVI
jgi:hypothetical protein